MAGDNLLRRWGAGREAAAVDLGSAAQQWQMHGFVILPGFVPVAELLVMAAGPSRLAGPPGLVSGQLSHDRGERVGEVGAEDEIGEAHLLPSPPDFVGGGPRVSRKYG